MIEPAQAAPMTAGRAAAFLFLALLALSYLPAWSQGATNGRSPDAAATPVYLFWTAACPHCVRAKAFLDALAAGESDVELRAFELSQDSGIDEAFVALSKRFGVAPPSVPLIVIGDRAFAGFESAVTTGAEIRSGIAACRKTSCPDVAAALIRGAGGKQGASESVVNAGARPAQIPQTIRLPIVGEIQTRSLSLPMLTIVLGALDGFNPCAMWVLVFLIGLLVGSGDAIRMWAFGAVFLLTSAVVYFAFMAAWLNVFLVLGSLPWIRAGIGLFAVGAGGYHLWEFVSNPAAACPVTSPGQHQRVMERLKAAVGQRSFVLGVAGIIVLAAAVNLIELLCSAGIPAVYTQVLVQSELPPAAYYGYLLLYIVVFLLDDVIVFVTAMATLRAMGLTAAYARYSHLIGGVVLGGVGVLMLVRPEWLSFA